MGDTYTNRQKKNFTHVSNALLRDPSISLKAKRLLSFLIALASNSHPRCHAKSGVLEDLADLGIPTESDQGSSPVSVPIEKCRTLRIGSLVVHCR
jgi:hypothetical protein